MNEFPEADVLVARGKYSTLASERRALLKGLRDDIEAITNNARRALQTEDLHFAIEQAKAARDHIDSALGRLLVLSALAAHLTELKPLAWGQKEPVL